jgi:hypothetical protein
VAAERSDHEHMALIWSENGCSTAAAPKVVELVVDLAHHTSKGGALGVRFWDQSAASSSIARAARGNAARSRLRAIASAAYRPCFSAF